VASDESGIIWYESGLIRASLDAFLYTMVLVLVQSLF
jgi:hypothetical protein